MVRAEHVRHEGELREALARLKLLGLDAATLRDAHAAGTSTIMVTAPQAGVITARPATSGMTVEASTVLATIAQRSPVWIIADVYERDVAQIAVGGTATATSAAYPGSEWRGRVTYIAPEVRPETRTVQVRVEVPNEDGRLKFGMFVDSTMQTLRTNSRPRGVTSMASGSIRTRPSSARPPGSARRASSGAKYSSRAMPKRSRSTAPSTWKLHISSAMT